MVGREPVRIAMWSGPRNISTAMMRAWENRADTAVVDEPFYGHYLKETGRRHPDAERVIASMETEPTRVAASLVGPVPGGRGVFYQKHMTHHMLPSVPRGWMADVRHAFLVRRPEKVLASLARVLDEVTVEEVGLRLQLELMASATEATGMPPPVVDADDVLADPRGTLTRLCRALGVPFDDAMLRWQPGPRDSDGAWGPHWYASVYETSGFLSPDPSPVELPGEVRSLVPECRALYDQVLEQGLHIA